MSAKSSTESHSSPRTPTSTGGLAQTDAATPVTMCTNQQASQMEEPCSSSGPTTQREISLSSTADGSQQPSQSSTSGASSKSHGPEPSYAGQPLHQLLPANKSEAFDLALSRANHGSNNPPPLPSYVQLEELESCSESIPQILIVSKEQLAGFHAVLDAFREQDYYYIQAQKLRNQKQKDAAAHLAL